MSGGTAYVLDLKPERVNREALATGELELPPLGAPTREIVTDLLEKHLAETESPLAAAAARRLRRHAARFIKVLPRDYAAVLQPARRRRRGARPRRRRRLDPNPGGDRWLTPRDS